MSGRPRPKVLIAIIAGAMGLSAAAQAQGPGLSRTDLQRHDLDVPGHEAIQVRVDFAPGGVANPHTHPGEEIVYVLKGALEYRIEGRPPVVLKPGDVVFIPTGVVHGLTNVGGDTASELATYIVEKGKPLVVPAK